MAACAAPLDAMDSLTLQTIIQLQLADTEELTGSTKGKQREGDMTDAELALQLYTQYLEDMSTAVADRKLAQSFTDAVLRDGDLIHELRQQDHQTRQDHEIALRLAGRVGPVETHGPLAEDLPSSETSIWSEEEMLAKVAAKYMQNSDLRPLSSAKPIDDDSPTDSPEAESSAWAASRPESNAKKVSQCIACAEEFDFYDVARAPCDHEYCRTCLTELFQLSMTDESLFPPRCCRQEIRLERVRFFLNPKLAKEFESKSLELSTQNRIYCFEPRCATFIPPSAVNEGIATCPACRRTTCTMCKTASHSGDCPEDVALQQLLEMAEEHQWQRCYSCRRLVELGIGCNHMSCRCGAQFCYICGEEWKTCECPQWDEQRLLNRAAQLVDRNPHRRLFEPPRVAHAQPGDPGSIEALVAPAPAPSRSASDSSRQNRIAEAVAHLRENHACSHNSWRYVPGRHMCEECHWILPKYIFQCSRCQLHACNRCRWNRL